MAFERKKIWGEQLQQLVALVEPLIQDLDLDFPIRQNSTLMVDEERSIYHFLQVVAICHPRISLFWKRKVLIYMMIEILSHPITGQR